MTLIPIPGMTEDALLNTSTEPKGGGYRPFPCDAKGWTKHTAVVVKATVKYFDNGNEALSIVVGNGQHGGEILIDLDPKKVGPGAGPDQAQKNLDALMLAIKILGAHTAGKLDTTKVDAAHGQIVEIIAKHKGFKDGKNGGKFHNVSLFLKGEVKTLTDVDTSVSLPELPANGAAVQKPLTDDIPF